jgi:two-component system, LytTR family, response regulator
VSDAGLTVLVVDDEAIARAGLARLLRTQPDITAVLECRNGAEAVETIRTDDPDLVFLDVQMPGVDGFGVIEEVGPENMPATVFVTAYDEYAVKAFDVNAADYLLKPFDRERLMVALARARKRLLDNSAGGLRSQIELMLRLLGRVPESTPATATARIAVRDSDDVIFRTPNEIDWVEAADNYVRIHCGGRSHLRRGTVTEMESQLGSDRFLRISRGVIVNQDRVQRVRRRSNGTFLLILADGTELTASRRYGAQVRAFLERHA